MPPAASPIAAITSWLPLRHVMLLQLLLLSIATRDALASPVSSPEIATKSAKAATAFNQPQQTQQQHQQQQQQQQQQQHQHQHQPKSDGQEAHLNSLTAYATNFDSISTGTSPHQPHFKPSYKLPDMETNFTPLQSGSGGGAHSLSAGSPVLMQYLPQTLNEGGIQYLQLIPTRPLIVPIGPSYQLTGSAPPLGPQQTLSPGFHPPMAAGGNSISEYGGRTSLLADNGPIPIPMPAPATLVELPSNLPYRLPTYANSLQPYRSSYRINREIKEKQSPGTLLSLNLNEYMPGAHDSPHPGYVRGRP